MFFSFSVDEPLENAAVLVDASVAEEGPPAAHLLATVKVKFDDLLALLLVVGTEEKLSLRACHKARTPKLYAVGLMARVRLVADAVDGDDREPVGYGMPSLHRCPCLALPFLLLGCVGRLVADGGGVDEHLCALEGHEACSFGIPLVPAYEHAETAYGGVDRVEAEVAGSEVELLVISGIIGDVHLAVFAGYRAVALYDHGRVVIEAGCTLLEKGGDDDDTTLLRDLSKEFGRWTGDGLGEVELVYVLCLTEIETVVQLLKDDELRALAGEGLAFGGEPLLVVFYVCDVMLLDDSYW